MLKLEDVKTVRIAGKGTCYMLPEQFAIYSEGLAKEKAAQEASKQEAKEELTPTTQAASPVSVGAAA